MHCIVRDNPRGLFSICFNDCVKDAKDAKKQVCNYDTDGGFRSRYCPKFAWLVRSHSPNLNRKPIAAFLIKKECQHHI